LQFHQDLQFQITVLMLSVAFLIIQKSKSKFDNAEDLYI